MTTVKVNTIYPSHKVTFVNITGSNKLTVYLHIFLMIRATSNARKQIFAIAIIGNNYSVTLCVL